MRTPYTVVLMVLLVALSTACRSTQKTPVLSDALPSGEPLFSLRKTECRGKCPAYELRIWDNGTALLTARKNFPRIGSFRQQLATQQIETLTKAFVEARFFDFKDEYTSRTTDLPTTFITFSHQGQVKRIRDYHGAPAELKQLETLLEQIAESDAWQTTP